MGYAYLDKGGILHISGSKNTAAKYSSNGKVIATEIRSQNGYPVINDMRAFMYSPEEMYVGGNAKTGKQIEPPDALAQLYRALM